MDTSMDNGTKGCCRRSCGEFSLGFFDENDTNGRTLDLKASFWTGERIGFSHLTKFILWGVTCYTYVLGWLESRPDAGFHLAYLTNWSLTYAVIYMTLSVLNTFACNSHSLIKATWVMYSVAAVHQVAASLLFWLLVFDPKTSDLGYYTVMSHGGVAAIVLLEGNLVNKVPVRLKHYLFNFLLGTLYLGWTIVQTLVLQYNPHAEDDDAATDDVAIYDVLRWQNDPAQAGIVAAIVLLVFLPVDHLIIWGISLCGRRYKERQLKLDSIQGSSSRSDIESP